MIDTPHAIHLCLNAPRWDNPSLDFAQADTDGGLARIGNNQAQRPDSKQVNPEVAVTHDGYVPALYQVLTENRLDTRRPVPRFR